MKITDDTGHRLLAYVHAAHSQGRPVTRSELDTYGKRPERARDVLGEVFRPFGQVSDPATDYLRRLGWAQLHGEAVTLTDLGAAVLRQLDADERAAAAADVSFIVFRPDDPVALAEVVASIAQVGEYALVDPYLDADGLVLLVRGTELRRVLVSPKLRANRTNALRAAVAALPAGEAVEVRASDQFHDRYVIPDVGNVWLLGASLNGIGKRMSTMVQLPDEPAGRSTREAFARCWQEASKI